tara:strand:+ start:199 stop:594 length:396 start_codon:yes stop_codon:yes gene_type:complete
MKYKVRCYEKNTWELEVEADSQEEAEIKAEEHYDTLGFSDYKEISSPEGWYWKAEKHYQKEYILALTGIIIMGDELDDTKIFRRNAKTGEECEIPFDDTDYKEYGGHTHQLKWVEVCHICEHKLFTEEEGV